MKQPRRTLLIAVLIALLSSSCGLLPSARATHSPSRSPSPAVVYDFAGLTASDGVEQIQALRATITWTVPPQLIPGYGVSTWIAFAAPKGSGGVSYRIAQVGWLENDPGHPRLFWEWGTSQPDTHGQLGDEVKEAHPLYLEIDRDGPGTYSFYADTVLLGTASVSWAPTALGVFVEIHNPAELLPGTATEPELITGLEEKIGGKWAPFSGQVLATRAQFRVEVSPDGSIRIWDVRQRGMS
jgi:hypothetical protein